MYTYIIYYILGIVMLPGIILGIIAQTKVYSTFNKYNKIPTIKGKKANEVARSMLNAGDCTSTRIAQIKGELTDNYNPQTNTVSLSESVYNNSTIASVGVTAHEIGHVFQHKQNYGPIKLRNKLVPVINISGILMWPLIIIGLILEMIYYSTFTSALIYIGIGLYALNTVFCLITLPIELNASKRAYKMLILTNEMDEEEAKDVKKVLNAAALTYVASLITSVLSLLRVLIFITIMRGDRR